MATLALAARTPTPSRLPQAGDLQRLAGRIDSSSTNLSTALDKTVRELRQTLQEGPADRLGRSLDSWNTSVRQMRALVESMVAPVELARQTLAAQKALASEETRLLSQVDALIHQVTDLTESTEASATQQVNMDERVTAMTDQVSQSMNLLSERLEGLGSLVDRIQDSLDRMDQEREW